MEALRRKKISKIIFTGMVFPAIYFVSFIWGGFLKEESENIPKALDLGNTSERKRRDGGACVNESLFLKN